ncbi:unnamed protein product [Cunninghamella blakesleeana]
MALKRHSPLFEYLKKEYIDFSANGNSERLISLYSDFSNLYLTNEYGYEVNIDYWHSLLLDCSVNGYLKYHGYTLVIDQTTLPEDFIRESLGKPIALGCVLVILLYHLYLKLKIIANRIYPRIYIFFSIMIKTPHFFYSLCHSFLTIKSILLLCVLCIYVFVGEMKKVGNLITLNDFNHTYKPPITWTYWVKQLTPTSLLSRSFSSSSSPVYVVLPSIKTISQHIYQTYSHLILKSNIKNALLTFSEFREHYGKYDNHQLTNANLILILKYLASQSTIALAEKVQGYGTTYMVVKFIEPGMPAEITDHDKAIISIKTTCEALHHQINDLETLIEKLTSSAKEYHNKKQQPQTLYALRRRKTVIKVLEKKLLSMETMETMLLKMESAKDDMQIVQAFDNGATALKNILNEGLSMKSVEETMEKIQDIYDDQRDAENLLTEEMSTLNQSTYEALSDESLLKELEELESEQLQTQSPSLGQQNKVFNQLNQLEPPPTKPLAEQASSSTNNIHEKTPMLE